MNFRKCYNACRKVGDEMRTRIKELRKRLDMTLEEFGQNIGVKKNTVSQIENGKNGITEQMLTSILNADWKGKRVNETWLRTGDGDPFEKLSKDEEIATFIGNIQMASDENFKKRFIAMLSRLDESEWELLEKMALDLQKEKD